MLAQLSRGPLPADAAWCFERKFDGLRVLAVRNGDEVKLWSRNHLSFNERFGQIVGALRSLPVESFALDGEIVAFDGGRTSFELLQRPGSPARPVLEVFDVVHLLGRDTTALAFTDRHRLVASLLSAHPAEPSGVLRPVEALTGDPDVLLRQACASGWEGLIAKRAESGYQSGRSRDWRKLKCDARQELVIGGWTEPQGSRLHLGAILVGVYDGDGALHYAGKVGSGFDRATLGDLHASLCLRGRPTSPFADPPRLRSVHWVEPDLVANIAFTEWTVAGKLRHPRFQGLRPDKNAREVVREEPH